MALAQEKPYSWEYDSTVFPTIDQTIFSAEHWKSLGKVVGKESGRGTTWFLQHGERQLVLRHYLRGGLIGRFNQDRYLYTGLSTTRSFHEFRILLALQNKNLPVPRPLAAQVIRKGISYQADLIMERIPDTKDLVSVLKTAQTKDFYCALGSFIAQFHRAEVYHADLNIKNILKDSKGQFWLIDFDRAQLKVPAGAKQNRSIARLQRSFEKEKLRSGIQFSSADWQNLEKAYRQSLKDA
jgi:3-deoxy-D-manno-octulosonic acid kinase